MAFQFPSAPIFGQRVEGPNGFTYEWNGTGWVVVGGGGGGGEGAASMARNLIINGDCSVDQRNGGQLIAVVGTAVGPDRFVLANYTGEVRGLSGQARSDASFEGTPIAPPAGVPEYCFVWRTTEGAYTPAADEAIYVYTAIESIDFNDALFGTVNAQPLVLEFWAWADVAGTYSGALQRAGRSHVFTYTLSSGVWVKVRINIPADAAAEGVADDDAGLWIIFSISVGSTYRHTTGGWFTGDFISASAAVNVTAFEGSLKLTRAALMIGAVPQSVEPQFPRFAENLRNCQRYYQVLEGVFFQGYAEPGYPKHGYFTLLQTMRAAPTVDWVDVGWWGQVGPAAADVDSSTSSVVGMYVAPDAAGLIGMWFSAILLDAEFW